MLALALYEYKNKVYPKEIIILNEGDYNDEDYKKAILKSKEIYDNGRYESVHVVEMDRKVYDDFLKAKNEEYEDYDLYEWGYGHSGDVDILFTSDNESIPEEVYFQWIIAEKNLEDAIYNYEHNSVENIKDGYSLKVGKDLYGDYWFAIAEEDFGDFHNANGRDIHKWQEWYKKEWIIDVTKQEIERLAEYENKGYKWVLKA